MKKYKKIIIGILGAIIVPPISIKVFISYFWFQIWLGKFIFNMKEWESGSIFMYGFVSVVISLIIISGSLGILDDEKPK